MRKITLIGLLVIIITCVGLLSGCQTYTEAEWAAGAMFWKNDKSLRCRHRVALIAKNMMERGDKFDLIIATPKHDLGSNHTWIEQYTDNPLDPLKVIEPSGSNVLIFKFEEIKRYHFEPGYEANIVVVSKINQWLNEKGLKLYHPIKNRMDRIN